MLAQSDEALSELYAAYCEFKNDAIRSILTDVTDSQLRAVLSIVHQPMRRQLFFELARRLHQRNFDRLEHVLRTGWMNTLHSEGTMHQ